MVSCSRLPGCDQKFCLNRSQVRLRQGEATKKSLNVLMYRHRGPAHTSNISLSYFFLLLVSFVLPDLNLNLKKEKKKYTKVQTLVLI